MRSAPIALCKEHANFSGDRFVGYDFDGTVALTFTPSPHNVTVASAYDTAIESVFGSRALEDYHENGGLKNRAPIEIIHQLAPDAAVDEQIALLTQLDRAKLAVLLEEITPQWPQPTNGYAAFKQRLHTSRERGSRITDAIVSSGHERFIAKTYDAWGMQVPTIILAQEAISAMAASDNIPMPSKPSMTIMRFAHTVWRGHFGLPPTMRIPPDEATRMEYTGDDRMKDGQMAVNAGIKFHLLNPSNSHETWTQLALGLGLVTLRQVNIV